VSLLYVKKLSVNFEHTPVLKDISFSVEQGEVLAIVGPNGSGKSVLLRTILGLVPHQGGIAWQGTPKIGYVPQHLGIEKDFPLSVMEFMAMKEPDTDKVMQSLAAVGIDGNVLHQRLGWLSGGQLQRVLIAWSIIDKPDVLLYDEPTSGIDVGGEETIYNLLKKLQDQRSMTIILVSHDLNIVYKYADNVMCINKKMICFGVPSKVLDPTALAQLYGGEAGFYQHSHHE
jgi:zinc transport system ATP-binding protein